MRTEAKTVLRRRLLSARREIDPELAAAESAALGTALAAAIDVGPGDTVCSYVPMGSEPGSGELLDVLADTGVRVLLPITEFDDDGRARPLRWGSYRSGRLVPARFGLREPEGPALAPAEIATARVIIVPALAVDRRGMRLGRGAGCYDRSLPLRDPAARLIAVVRDEELLEQLPADEHDVAMTHVATPGRGVIALG